MIGPELWFLELDQVDVVMTVSDPVILGDVVIRSCVCLGVLSAEVDIACRIAKHGDNLSPVFYILGPDEVVA